MIRKLACALHQIYREEKIHTKKAWPKTSNNFFLKLTLFFDGFCRFLNNILIISWKFRIFYTRTRQELFEIYRYLIFFLLQKVPLNLKINYRKIQDLWPQRKLVGVFFLRGQCQKNFTPNVFRLANPSGPWLIVMLKYFWFATISQRYSNQKIYS